MERSQIDAISKIFLPNFNFKSLPNWIPVKWAPSIFTIQDFAKALISGILGLGWKFETQLGPTTSSKYYNTGEATRREGVSSSSNPLQISSVVLLFPITERNKFSRNLLLSELKLRVDQIEYRCPISTDPGGRGAHFAEPSRWWATEGSCSKF